MKNYTSTVDSARSIELIEQMLVRAKAMNITKSYDANGKVVSFLFTLKVPESPLPMAIMLPGKVDAVYECLTKGKRLPPHQRLRASFIARHQQQAERTAWRLMYDWLSVQLSLIELRQVEAAQVFLPFAWNGRQTFFETIRAAKFLPLLGPAKPEDDAQEGD